MVAQAEELCARPSGRMSGSLFEAYFKVTDTVIVSLVV